MLQKMIRFKNLQKLRYVIFERLLSDHNAIGGAKVELSIAGKDLARSLRPVSVKSYKCLDLTFVHRYELGYFIIARYPLVSRSYRAL